MSPQPETIDGRQLTAIPDLFDYRDFQYQPSLTRLVDAVPAPELPIVLDQGQEGACTGFGLAAVVNLLLANRGEPRLASPRMLYEMAKKFDEWEGEDYSGSSCRGAIKGWHSSGVCSDDLAPYQVGEEHWEPSIDQAIDARATTLGAYYRVASRLSDWHAALGEVGALFVSARVHDGWSEANVADGVIGEMTEPLGGHAFAVVGYNKEGFIVQNSWGESWGDRGKALWKYEDWIENVTDAWVVALAVSTPQVWHLSGAAGGHAMTNGDRAAASPRRDEIVGHFAHIDDGEFDEKGRYWTTLTSVQETAQLLGKSTDYDHLLFYAHGGLNDIAASARRIAAFKQVFKENGIYPFHFMYDTGLLEEIKDVVAGKSSDAEERAEGFADVTDLIIENATRHVGRAIWREMKQGARSPFAEGKAGHQVLQAFVDGLDRNTAKPKKIHLVGHSTGAVLLAALLDRLQTTWPEHEVETCLLMAPACTHEVFNNSYAPVVERRAVKRMKVYNLSGRLELDDTVTPVYRKSLLYLVSRAYEERKGESILGIQDHHRRLRNLPGPRLLKFEVSEGPNGTNARTTSRTHGGFDNDAATMNDVVATVLGSGGVTRQFTTDDLVY